MELLEELELESSELVETVELVSSELLEELELESSESKSGVNGWSLGDECLDTDN